jgi:putative nucleotidyltransferase with HDIG domain
MAVKTERVTDNTVVTLVKTLVSVIEEKDEYLKGHSERVAAKCVRFSKKLGLSKRGIESLYLAGLLHDIGTVYIPLEITQKRGELSRDETIMWKQHPIISEKILSKHSIFNEILPIVRHHHEAFDGSGYPDGVKGDDLSVETRILCLVNSYEAMVSARSHRPSFSAEEALEFIEKDAGRRFDRNLAHDFVGFIRSTEVSSIGADSKEVTGTAREIVLGIVKKAESGEIDLPVLPKVLQEIQNVMNQPNSTAEDVAKVVERDGVISIRLISLSNSPMYRGTEKIYAVKQAIARLGVKETRSIVTAIANRSLYETKNDRFRTLMQKLWLHSLACAYGSRAIAKMLGLRDIEKLFLMGLLHDIGKPPLLKILSETFDRNGSLEMADIIDSVQEAHTSFGGALLKGWGLTQEFRRIAMHHEGPTFPSKTESSLLIVNLANNLVRNIGYTLFDDNDEVVLSDLESAKLQEIDPESLDPIGQEIQEIMRETAHIF